jgi:hypothetical protein
MRHRFVELVLIVGIAGCAVEEPSVEERLIGSWQVVRVDGEVHPSETRFIFTEEGEGSPAVFIIGVATDKGCCLHSAFMPYTVDASQTPPHLDYQGTWAIPSQIGVFQFVDESTLAWKVTAADKLRPTNFAPHEADRKLYELRRID